MASRLTDRDLEILIEALHQGLAAAEFQHIQEEENQEKEHRDWENLLLKLKYVQDRRGLKKKELGSRAKRFEIRCVVPECLRMNCTVHQRGV